MLYVGWLVEFHYRSSPALWRLFRALPVYKLLVTPGRKIITSFQPRHPRPKTMILLHWALVLVTAMGSRAQSTISPEGTNPASGYRFRYFVRDDKTGDIKGQSEVRQGDDVQGSYAVADPNGNTRVVTYTAGKDTGFNARVQVHSGTPLLPPLPNGEPQLPLGHLMKIPPRNIFRTGFQPVEIKVVPPTPTEAPQVTQKPPFSPEEEAALLRGQQELPKPGYSEQHLEVYHSPTEANRVDSSTVHEEGTPSDGSLGVLSSTTTKDELEPCLPCDNPEENTGRIKQDGDKVQLEMGQVIRTEMKDPVDVNMGKPYQGHNPPHPYQIPHARPHMPQAPYPQLRPDVMTPIYMKPLFLRNPNAPNAPQWPPLVSSGNQLYIPHIVVEKEDSPPEIFPSKVYLVPLPRPLSLYRDDLTSQAHPWDDKTTVPKEDQSGQYKPRPINRPAFIYPQTFTYLLLPKDTRGK